MKAMRLLAVLAVVVLVCLQTVPVMADPAPGDDTAVISITPMEPPPPPRRAKGERGDESRVVSYDIRKKAVVERSMASLESILGPRYTEAGIGVDELLNDPEGVAKTFTGWSYVGNPASGDYPRRVKLYIKFTDLNGAPVNIQCSGTLIDPKHVLTAAHCIWSHEIYGTDYIIQDFADEGYVVPGYQAGNEPFGRAEAAQFHVWGAWIDDFDYDHDIGIIDLERPIGALTGWWGYGLNVECDFWESWSWRHEGWPGEAPFDGQQMYQNGGDFDDCEQAGWDNRAAWYGPSWGGLSGSGAAKAGTGQVYGVFSTSDRATVSVDCKVTPLKFIHIQSIINEDIPAALDLVVMDMKGPAQVEAGYRPSFMNFAVLDYSWASQSGTWNYSMYLSPDSNIGPNDIYLGSGSFTHSFVPNGAVRVNVPLPPMIPAGTPGGSYYLGVMLAYADANLDNNESSGQEAWPIEILCPATEIPTLLTPANFLACGNLTQYLAWTAVAPLAEYQVQVGISCGTGPIVTTRRTDITWPELAPGMTYFWRVRAASQCAGQGTWSQCWSFSTLPDPTALTTLISPANGAHCQPASSVTLDWEALPWADTYELQLSPYGCGSGTILTGIPGSQRTVTGLIPNTTYYWHVRARTTCGQTTDWSPMPGVCWSFKTAPTGVIAPPVKLHPADGTSCGAASSVLTWNAIPDAGHYELQVGTSCGTGPVYTVPNAGFTVPGLASNETYYWRVRAFHECGQVSAWTDCWSFSLDLEPPTSPTTLTSISHTVGTWSADNTVDVVWDRGSDNCDGDFSPYATLWDTSPTTEPTEMTFWNSIPETTSPPLVNGQDHWYHVRTIDWAGNLAAETLHLGPFWIDATVPTTPKLDYATLDPGLITGQTTLVVDWLPATDEGSGLAGYSWNVAASGTPPPELDKIGDLNDLWASALLAGTGQLWFFVRAVDVAGNTSGDLTLGPYTIDSTRLGIYVTSPGRDEVLTEGSVHRIRWSLRDMGATSVQGARLDYSLDGGETYLPIGTIFPVQVYMEYFDWTVPMAASDEAVVRLKVMDVAGREVYGRSVRFTLDNVTAVRDLPAADRCVLAEARPNPFNPRTTIEYSVPRGMYVSLRIFDVQGRSVRTLVDGWRDGPSWHTAVWDGCHDDGRQVAAGVYFYRLEAGLSGETRRMTLVK